MKIKALSISVFLLFALVINSIAQKTSAKPIIKAKIIAQPTKPKIDVTNNINITSNGFKIQKAYLEFEDGTPVPSNNKVEVNQKVVLWLIIDSGWTDIEGKAYPGASEKITLSTGGTILENNDLFEAYTEKGASIEDVKYISLKAVITQLNDLKKNVIVSFKVWDKKGTASLSGKYKLIFQ